MSVWPFKTGMYKPWPAGLIRPRKCFIRPSQQVNKYKICFMIDDGNFMTEFELIEPLTILQLITIQNSSDGNNIKKQQKG